MARAATRSRFPSCGPRMAFRSPPGKAAICAAPARATINRAGTGRLCYKPAMTQRPVLTPPNGEKKVLLHSCCAPCSGEVMEAMTASGVDYTIFFYNPNIHPKREYELRKQENICFAEQHGIGFSDRDYDADTWFARAKGMEWEPERGARCTMCFDMRFDRTALYAFEHGFPVITSCLGLSRWKDMDQINASGERVAAKYPGVTYWT